MFSSESKKQCNASDRRLSTVLNKSMDFYEVEPSAVRPVLRHVARDRLSPTSAIPRFEKQRNCEQSEHPDRMLIVDNFRPFSGGQFGWSRDEQSMLLMAGLNDDVFVVVPISDMGTHRATIGVVRRPGQAWWPVHKMPRSSS
jgi:hypothetical protein